MAEIRQLRYFCMRVKAVNVVDWLVDLCRFVQEIYDNLSVAVISFGCMRVYIKYV